MPESKYQFPDGPDAASKMRAIYQSTSAEERAFQSLPNPGRPRLTPRDHEYNRKVKQLFENIIPGLPIDADAPELRREPACMETVVEGVMKQLNITGHSWINELKEAWPQIINAEIARQTIPGKLENNILFVYVISSTALFELRRTRLKEIEAAVKKFAPEKKIRYVKLMVNSVNV
ncbi:MAG: DciA family protein [Kiritimatiellae bacterium]|nr:DciA family protein [Kiritimatiellia bacterium]